MIKQLIIYSAHDCNTSIYKPIYLNHNLYIEIAGKTTSKCQYCELLYVTLPSHVRDNTFIYMCK